MQRHDLSPWTHDQVFDVGNSPAVEIHRCSGEHAHDAVGSALQFDRL